MIFDTARYLETGVVCEAPLSIYTGILGQIGDILMFTATARRLKELFPRSRLTFAVSARYREAGELVAGLPYVDRRQPPGAHRGPLRHMLRPRL
jgi:hypothetical protein